MTMKKFCEAYYLHDSSLEKVIYSTEEKTLTLIIDFCFWMQDDYQDGYPENGYISVIFSGVSAYEGISCGDVSFGILQSRADAEDKLTIAMIDDNDNLYSELSIAATSVEVVSTTIGD